MEFVQALLEQLTDPVNFRQIFAYTSGYGVRSRSSMGKLHPEISDLLVDIIFESQRPCWTGPHHLMGRFCQSLFN
jgi:hypothetical protein